MKEPQKPILAGRISATPNPLPPGDGPCTIRWETTPPTVAEVVVSENGAPEKVVARGETGNCELVWVRADRVYLFHLYTSDVARRRLASVSVSRSTVAIDSLLDEASGRLNSGELNPEEFGKFVASLIGPRLGQPEFAALFRLWEANGFHVTSIGEDQPIPDTRELAAKTWEKPQELAGFDLNPSSQRRFVREIFPAYRKELEDIRMTHSKVNDKSFLLTGRPSGLDAAITHCMVRYYSPRRLVEVGGGHSTVLLRNAMRLNRRGSLVCLETKPDRFLLNRKTGPDRLFRRKLTEVAPAAFARLRPGDILSVKTSHLVRLGSDVNYLFLEVLPQLQTGVLIHLSDIFLPFDYPREWIMQHRRFWTAQYLLQAFLSGNADFEVLVGTSYLLATQLSELSSGFPRCERMEGSAFWIRRRRSTGAKRLILTPNLSQLNPA